MGSLIKTDWKSRQLYKLSHPVAWFKSRKVRKAASSTLDKLLAPNYQEKGRK